MTALSNSLADPAVAGAVLRSFAGRQLLFVEARQAIYELDYVSTQIWRLIDAGIDRQAIADWLVSGGSNQDDARTRLEDVCEIRSSGAPD
jgi:hypothetical protein